MTFDHDGRQPHGNVLRGCSSLVLGNVMQIEGYHSFHPTPGAIPSPSSLCSRITSILELSTITVPSIL